MKTPVIIPAFNEASQIGPTLRALDHNTVEPFVIVNGEKGADETAAAALMLTPNVFILPEQGKLPAIQYALKKLIEYDKDVYVNPILLSDADSWPLVRADWARVMGQAVAGNVARSAAGLTLLADGPVVDCGLRNARRLMRARQDQGTNTLRSAFGANMAINFANDHELLERVLEVPHVWPGEDRYLLHLAGGDGERERFTQLASIGSTVLTSSRFLKPLVSTFGQSMDTRLSAKRKEYTFRKADSVTHFFDDEASLLREHAQKLA